MKNVLMFPINIFKYAYKGVKYSIKVITGGTKKGKEASTGTGNKFIKLEGEELAKELERVQAERNSIKKTNIAWHKHLDEREKRRQKFTGSFMAIFLINFMCIVSLWITDHTEVFVGKAGVANFFISLENGFISTSRGIIYFLNCAVSVLQRCMSIDVAQAIVYGLSLIWVFIWVVLGILKAIPDVRKKFEDIISIYKNNGEFGYKKAVTISLCTIALCCAIFVAEYAMFNVITIWLILSVSFNILYHLIAYEIS